VQVDPIKPPLKAPGLQRFKVKYDKLLSSFGFKFNLRRYIMAARKKAVAAGLSKDSPLLSAQNPVEN
jgi:hypothetical protein